MGAFSNTIGFDDAPFSPNRQGAVPIVGAVYSRTRFDGVLIGEVRKDGFDGAAQICSLIRRSKFDEHIQLVLLQGITLAGFNVVDVFHLWDCLRRPVIVVSRRHPNLDAVRRALLGGIPEGMEKWNVVQRLGPMHALGRVFVQCVGLELEQAERLVERLALHGNMPEPLRTAHLIAGALADGESRGRT